MCIHPHDAIDANRERERRKKKVRVVVEDFFEIRRMRRSLMDMRLQKKYSGYFSQKYLKK